MTPSIVINAKEEFDFEVFLGSNTLSDSNPDRNEVIVLARRFLRTCRAKSAPLYSKWKDLHAEGYSQYLSDVSQIGAEPFGFCSWLLASKDVVISIAFESSKSYVVLAI